MTVMEIAKTYDLLPKDVTAFIQANATFPVKRNFQTGEISIPDDVDIQSFIAPLWDKVHPGEREKANRIAQQQREAAEKATQQKRLAAERATQEQRAATELRLHQEDLARQKKEASYAVEIEKLKKSGAEDVTICLYEKCRHEIHNDTCKEKSRDDILNFILR